MLENQRQNWERLQQRRPKTQRQSDGALHGLDVGNKVGMRIGAPDLNNDTVAKERRQRHERQGAAYSPGQPRPRRAWLPGQGCRTEQHKCC